jgi:hypothetical protein
MAYDWNRSKNIIHPRYNGGNHNYDIYAEDVADAIRLLGFKSESDYEGNPFEQYRLEANSSNGVIMTHSKFSTVLSVSLYLNNINITERTNKKCFKWARVSSNTEADKEWNKAHKDGLKELTIDAIDIIEDTVFHCAYVSTAVDEEEEGEDIESEEPELPEEEIVYDNIFNVPFNSILATASISIVNQSTSAELMGSLLIESGNKNQIYTAGLPAPYSPDWKIDNLIIKPYCTASTITKIDDEFKVYNPNLFDINEYPDLNDEQYYERNIIYIKNLKWFTRSVSGIETEIFENENFSFIYGDCPDNRFLIIKNNFLPRDSYVTIICKYDYNDPFTNAIIPQTYSMDLSCIATGQGTDQLLINNVLGTSIHNNDPAYIELFVSYFSNGEDIDVQTQIEDPTIQSSIQWYKRASSEDGWILLDAVTQDENEFNTETTKCYEIRRYMTNDGAGNFETEKTYSARGGFLLRIYPALIKSSDVIKAIFTNTNKSGAQFTATEVVYDTTDMVQAYITSSAGDKLYKDIDTNGTILTCMINYQGQLLENGDPRYGDDDYTGNQDGEQGLFDYYWFKMSQDGSITYNLFLDYKDELQMQLVNDDTTLINGPRSITIKAQHIDDLNMFQCFIVDKKTDSKILNITNLERSLPSEAIVNEASTIANNPEDIINLAHNLNNKNDK